MQQQLPNAPSIKNIGTVQVKIPFVKNLKGPAIDISDW
jgi:hypothetical protein